MISSKGKAIKKLEMLAWKPSDFVSFMRFTIHFTQEIDVDGGGKKTVYDISDSKIKDMEGNIEYTPLFKRIIKSYPDEKGRRTCFMNSLKNFHIYIKDNLYCVTPEMKEVMDSHPFFKGVDEVFKGEVTKIGGEIVGLNNPDPSDPDKKLPVKLPEVVYNQALLQLTQVFEKLIDSVDMKKFAKLDEEKKIRLAATIAPVLTKAYSGMKAGGNLVFNKIVVNQAGRDELEKAMLDEVEQQ